MTRSTNDQGALSLRGESERAMHEDHAWQFGLAVTHHVSHSSPMQIGDYAHFISGLVSNGIGAWVVPVYRAIMSTRLTLDKAGRIVIPKSLRDELQLGPGDALELEFVGEEITLRPVRGTAPLIKERGVWVFRIGQPLSAATTDEVLRRIRDERHVENLGR